MSIPLYKTANWSGGRYGEYGAGGQRANGFAAGAGPTPPLDALHPPRRQRHSDHRARRGVLRLRRSRQPLSRRALGAVLREHRARPRRHRAGGRRPGEGARVLHQLVLRAPARDRARDADRGARAGRPQPGVLHERRQRGGRVGAEARAPVPQAARPRAQAQGDRAGDRVPRHVARRAVGDRRHRAAHAVRAARAGRLPRPQHEYATGCRRG